MLPIKYELASILRSIEKISAAQEYIRWRNGNFCGPCMSPQIFDARLLADDLERTQTLVAGFPWRDFP